jgi:hypothetical protein
VGASSSGLRHPLPGLGDQQMNIANLPNSDVKLFEVDLQ